MRGSVQVMVAIATLGLITATAPGATAATLRVPADYATIQAAISAASKGDEVIVAPGIYHESVTMSSPLLSRLSSTDPSDPAVVSGTVIDGGGTEDVMDIEGNVGSSFTLEGFTLRNGLYGIWCSGSPVIHRCTVSSNSRAGIEIYGGAADVEDSTVTGNSGPGVLTNGSAAVFRRCDISRNASPDGAGIYATGYGTPRFENCTISGNLASRWGGG